MLRNPVILQLNAAACTAESKSPKVQNSVPIWLIVTVMLETLGFASVLLQIKLCRIQGLLLSKMAKSETPISQPIRFLNTLHHHT